MVEYPSIEAIALPFTFGMALGLGIGRVILQSTPVGVLLGVFLVFVFLALRQVLVS